MRDEKTRDEAGGLARDADVGSGVYSFPLAARLIRQHHPQVSPRRLRYWVKTGLAPTSFGRDPSGSDALSFQDLVSLELIGRLLDAGASLQGVRRADEELRRLSPETLRPFAHEAFFTDGSSVWAQVNPEESGRVLIELVGRRPRHYVWRDAIATFAKEIRYKRGVAAGWQVHEYVELDPQVHFGAPVLLGTGVLVSTIAKELEIAGDDEVADWHGLPVELVRGVRSYVDAAA